MHIRSAIEIVVIAPFPTTARISEGWMSRIHAIDRLLQPRQRLYINFAPNHCSGDDDQFIHHGNGAWEICLSPTSAAHLDMMDILVRMANCVYVHTVHHAEFILPWLTTGKIIVDFHGIVPEEEIMMGFPELAHKYEQIEQEVLRHARSCVMVTNTMKTHYQTKYPDISPRVIILPIVEAITPANRNDISGDEIPVRAVYAGGVQPWQNIDAMIKLSLDARHHASFTFLSHDWELISAKAKAINAPHSTRYQFCPKEKLSHEYANANFGLVLRDDTAVNNVACPTKLYEYLALGLIPIVRSHRLGDFPEFNYCYITEDEFRHGFFPHKISRKSMANQNMVVVKRIKQRFIHGAQDLARVINVR